MSDDFDALREWVPLDLRAEFDRLHPKPQPRQPDPEPEPPKDNRKLVSDDGVRVYTQTVDAQQQEAEQYAQRLREAHSAWEQSGYPPDGPIAETLMFALSDSYLVAPPDSPEEQELVEYAEAIGAEHVIEESATAFNRMATKLDHQERGRETVEALWPKDREVDRRLKEYYERNPDLLEAIAAGDVSTDEVRELLGEHRAAHEESVLADRRFEKEIVLDEALVRESGLMFAPETEEQFRKELAEKTDKLTRVDPEAVVERRERLLGRAPQKQAETIEQIEADFRAIGALPDPEDEAMRERWREAAKTTEESER